MKAMIKNFMGTVVGVPLIEASSNSVAALNPGLPKTLLGTAVGLQAVTLVGHSAKPLMKHTKPMKMHKMKY